MVETFATREVEEHFVDARDLRDRRVVFGNRAYLRGVVPVKTVPGRQVDRAWRTPRRFGERHARAHSERARLVAARRDHTTLPWQAAHHDRLTHQARVQ